MATHSITHAGFASHNHTGGRLEQNGFGWFAVARETGYVITHQRAGDAVKDTARRPHLLVVLPDDGWVDSRGQGVGNVWQQGHGRVQLSR